MLRVCGSCRVWDLYNVECLGCTGLGFRGVRFMWHFGPRPMCVEPRNVQVQGLHTGVSVSF